MLKIITLAHPQNPEPKLRSWFTPNESNIIGAVRQEKGLVQLFAESSGIAKVFMGLFCPRGFSLADLQSGKMQPNGNLRGLSSFPQPFHSTGSCEKKMVLLWDKEHPPPHGPGLLLLRTHVLGLRIVLGRLLK